MMKIISATAITICLLLVACKKEGPASLTNTETTATSTATATPTAMDTATTTTGTVESQAKLVAATNLNVFFTGMVTFVLSNGAQRAVLPRIGGHHLQIVFPFSMKTQVEATFKGVKCVVDCPVPFDGRAFRVVDASGNPLPGGFNPSSTFASTVTHLQSVPLPASLKDTFDVKNIEPDVFKDPQKGSFIAGFFELAGGTGDAQPFTCTAHFQGQAGSHSFPMYVIVNFKLPAGAKLQVFEAGSTGWADLVTLTTLTGPVKVTVDNNMPGPVSHFDDYALLSTKRIGGKPVDLPDVIPDTTNCIPGHGDVPGCSDSQWP